MKRSHKTLISLLLVLVFAFACALPAFASVTLPANVSASEITAALPKLDAMVTNLVASQGKGSLKEQVYAEILSDKSMNEIFKGLYGALSGEASTMRTLGIDLSLQGVKANLYNYPEVQAAIGENTDWAAVLNDGFSPRWNLRTKDDVSIALGAMLAPMNELLYTLLCAGTYRLSPLVAVNGANGYENAVVPLYRALGIRNFESQADFTAGAKKDRSYMFSSIVNTVFGALDEILASPVTELTKRLPGIAAYLENDSLKAAVTTLLEPMKIRVAVFQLSGVDKLIENMGLFANGTDLASLLQSLDLGSLLGTDAPLTLPEIRLSDLAACGTQQGDYVVSDQAKTFTVLFRWLLDAARTNKAALASAAGTDTAILDRFLKKSNDEILRLLLDLLNLTPGQTVLDYQWTFAPYTAGTVPMTPTLTVENYAKMLDGIDETLNEFLNEFTEDGTLSGLIAEKLYSSSVVTALAKAVYGTLYSEETAAAMSMLGVSASPAGIAGAVRARYPGVATALSRYSKWENVPDTAFFWLTPGSKEGFVSALTAVLSPLRPLLTMLLAEGSVNLLGAVTVYGSNGYNTAVIPLLEALGCDADTIRPYAEYKATAGTNRAITDILDPVAALLDRIVEEPVATVCEILPNLLYFLKTGGLQTAVNNLLYPVKTLLEKMGMADLLSEEVSAVGEIDINGLLKTVAANADVQLKLPEPDLDLIMSLGTAEEVVSKRTYAGANMTVTHIRANAPEVLLTVLRYIVGALGDEENSAVLSGLLQQDTADGTDMFAMYTGKITEQLKTMTPDETVEWLYNLLFSESPKREEAPDDTNVPTVIYKERKPRTALKRSVVIVLIVLAVVIGALVLSRINFTAGRERRKYLRDKRRAASNDLKAAAAAAKAKTAKKKAQPKTAPPEETEAPAAPKKVNPWVDPLAPKSTKKPVPAASPVDILSQLRPETESDAPSPDLPEAKAETEAPASPTKKDLKAKLSEEKKIIREKIKEEKARNKAYRRTKKADKYYEADRRKS